MNAGAGFTPAIDGVGMNKKFHEECLHSNVILLRLQNRVVV
jgi:hypothetical protein